MTVLLTSTDEFAQQIILLKSKARMLPLDPDVIAWAGTVTRPKPLLGFAAGI